MSTQILTQVISGRLDLISLPKINLQKIWISGFILTSLLLVFYVFQISEITQASFLISEQGQKISALYRLNKGLESNLSQKNSSANLETVLKKFNYEKVSKVYYIQILDNGMAVKTE